MPDLLVIGDITDAMRARIDARFTVHIYGVTDLAAVGTGVTQVLTNGALGLPEDVMAACPNLRMVSSYGVGYDAVDTDACVARGIVVTHTPDVLNAEVATTAVLLMLASYRNLLGDDAYVRDGRWEREGSAPLTRSADGRRVGLLGMGRIGQEIARKLAVLDAQIAYHSRTPKDVPYRYVPDLVQLAEDVEVLICITPGGAGTRHLVNREVLDALGPEGTLINVARGSVVHEKELVWALQDGRLGYAGLDVFEDEPRVPEALRNLSNVVLLPHAGSATHETRAAMGTLTVDNLEQFLDAGTVLTPVPECTGLVTGRSE